MLIGPDGKPLAAAPVLGTPKLEDLPTLTPEQMIEVAKPIRQALEAGVAPQSPCNVEFGMVAQLVNTVLALQSPLPRIEREAGEE